MAVDILRKGWLEMYSEMRSPSSFLTRFFTVKNGGIYDGEKIAMDIERFDEDVAIVIEKCTGPNINDISTWTTKEFTPPSYGEGFPLNACDLYSRLVGVDPYSAAGIGYRSQLVAMLTKGFSKVDQKIQRAIELQASQILQTGILTLTNKDGDTVYTIDFKPKATHFPTAVTDWDAVGNDPLGDLEALAEINRSDGKISPNTLIFGDNALKNFLANTAVQSNLNNRRFELGGVNPRFDNSGATSQGNIWIGNYKFEMWSYPETYTDPQSGNPTKFIDTNKVIMLSDKTRLDMTSARVPLPLGPDPRVASLLPSRIFSRAGGFDVTPNIYSSPDGKQIMGDLESRTLLIPVQIDGFCCIDTIA